MKVQRGASGGDAAPDEFRPGVVRRDFLDGLNLADDERAEELSAALAGHLRELIPRVQARMPAMDTERRRMSEHCLGKAAEELEMFVREPISRTFYLAVCARALLSLYRWPRPHSDLDEDEQDDQDSRRRTGGVMCRRRA
ncbi:DUF6415 family natural product biosynthesis protein [Streptomyces sp. NPDC088847]|uniref:DUF6415 family natural product biosynthesis protein n=1 Tax=Streptomyces sp. NPDC088847 TaxID=3365909 RepID=UPI00381BB198